MDAAKKTPTNTRLLALIALALVLAAPGWPQLPTPAFTLSTSTVNLNQSVTGATVAVGSTGASNASTISFGGIEYRGANG